MSDYEIGDRVRIVKSPYFKVKVGAHGMVASIERNRNNFGYDMIRIEGLELRPFWDFELEKVEIEHAS